jgi:hypothetical protein
MSELQEEILDRVRREVQERLYGAQVDCPECESMEDDQYTCTTCWCEGGNGRLRVSEYLKIEYKV